MNGPTRADAEALDRADPLAAHRDAFVVADADLCYLDGHSLGRLPVATAARLRRVVEEEWGTGLVRSWDDWIDLPSRAGDALAPLLGAGPGEVVVADSVTADLHRLVHAACELAPDRRCIVTTAGDFPTDRYVVAEVARSRGLEVHEVANHPVDGPDPAALAAAVDEGTVAVVASLVDFRSAAVLDPAPVLGAARAAGALVLWDCSHAAGAVPVDLPGTADMAVGCTYKHLHGGPGAPAWVWVRPDLVGRVRSPVPGWFADRDQFAMTEAHDPHPDARRFLAGTPAILALSAVDEAARLLAEADGGPGGAEQVPGRASASEPSGDGARAQRAGAQPPGGSGRLRAKVLSLSTLAQACVEARLAPLGFRLASPPDPARRGAHLTLAHPDAAAVGRAARALAGVVPDVRPPDLLRLGLSPLATSHVEVWDGIDRLAALVASGHHRADDLPPSRVT